ncbi:DUF1800 domain-containing protein [Trinickia sp. LjRoot230]|uniref:DUF1800 domain-containing protein n=1 Tax=Trinickia sp. LjRoot230 TaxID=3342288 RepID=UPI003ECF2056
MVDSSHMSGVAVALNRFGLGARPGDAAPAEPKAWVLGQLDAYDPWPASWRDEPSARMALDQFAQARKEAAAAAKTQMLAQVASAGMTPAASEHSASPATQPAAKPGATPPAPQTAKQALRKALAADARDTYLCAVDARVNSALATSTPFVERLVHFWSNHFAISVEKPEVAVLAGAFEAEAIRPYVLGRFEDMLIAVEQHPAMQFYLDQVVSVGPGSPAAVRANARNAALKRGLNENLAREIMELHTLGARSGYTQDDVTEFARALTGWGIAGPHGGVAGTEAAAHAPPGTFIFRPARHEPGERSIMGRRYPAVDGADAANGDAQARAVLRDLCHAAATAHHIAYKLARHFSADTPNAALVEQLARAFQTSGGDLPTVYRALIASPHAWSPAAAKFKTPWEWAISAWRGMGVPRIENMHAAPLFAQLGQPVWRPGSPAGYDDVAASWAAPDALLRRVELAQAIAARVGDRLDPRQFGPMLVGGALTPPTATAVAHADSVSTALALLLVSPEFQRR